MSGCLVRWSQTKWPFFTSSSTAAHLVKKKKKEREKKKSEAQLTNIQILSNWCYHVCVTMHVDLNWTLPTMRGSGCHKPFPTSHSTHTAEGGFHLLAAATVQRNRLYRLYRKRQITDCPCQAQCLVLFVI